MTAGLNRFFLSLVERRLQAGSGVAPYVAGVLADFAPTDRMYKIRNARGRRLEDVAEMILESHPLLQAGSCDREREVRKHIGDYTMFLAGLFPEYVATLPRRGLRLDSFIDYLKAGKESYRIVSSFDQFEYRAEAPLFRRLSDCFELCVFALNQVSGDLRAMQEHSYSRWRLALELH